MLRAGWARVTACGDRRTSPQTYLVHVSLETVLGDVRLARTQDLHELVCIHIHALKHQSQLACGLVVQHLQQVHDGGVWCQPLQRLDLLQLLNLRGPSPYPSCTPCQRLQWWIRSSVIYNVFMMAVVGRAYLIHALVHVLHALDRHLGAPVRTPPLEHLREGALAQLLHQLVRCKPKNTFSASSSSASLCVKHHTRRGVFDTGGTQRGAPEQY